MKVGVAVLSRFQHWWHTCLGLVYPAQCVGCAQRIEVDALRMELSDWLCGKCLCTLPKLEAPFCSSCGEAFDAALSTPMRCDNCEGRKLSFEFARAGYHALGVVREIIHGLKYHKQLHLRRVLGLLAMQALEDERLQVMLKEEQKPILVPVPLHPTRQRLRGFNQSEILAEELAKYLKLRVCRALERCQPTDAQATLTRAQRLENLRHAFKLSPSYAQQHSSLRGRTILLLDDVFTTGATVDECARLLRREGKVQKVVVVTAARG